MPSLSVIIPTGGEPTTGAAVQSVLPQLATGDELIVVRLDCPWGGQARNRAMGMATGDYLVFLDADDVMLASALQEIRFQTDVHPGRLHCFSMRTVDGHTLTIPEGRMPVMGEIGTPMLCVPNDHRLGEWSDRYETDFDFWHSTRSKHRTDPIRHETVICQIRPHERAGAAP